MVALGGLLEPGLVRLQLVPARPGRAVDPLQLRVRLVAAPVGRRRAHQRVRRAGSRCAARAGRGTGPSRPHCRRAGRCRRWSAGRRRPRRWPLRRRPSRPLSPISSSLYGSCGQLGARLVVADLATDEPLPLLDDPPHLLLDGSQVLGGERAGRVEVVVVAVGDGGPMPSLASGYSAWTACAVTWAVECRRMARPSGESMATASTSSSGANSRARSRSSPLTRMATTVRSAPNRSSPVVAVSTTRASRESGRTTVMETDTTRLPSGRGPAPGFERCVHCAAIAARSHRDPARRWSRPSCWSSAFRWSSLSRPTFELVETVRWERVVQRLWANMTRPGSDPPGRNPVLLIQDVWIR